MKDFFKTNNATLILDDANKALKRIPEKSIDLIFADPPYFLSNNGITCSGGRMVNVNKGEWDKSQGFKGDVEFHEKWIKSCDRVLKDNGSMWISGSYHCIHQIAYILLSMGYYIINEVTWFKNNAPPNLGCRCLTASHETVLWVKKSKKSKHTFNYTISKQYNNGKQLRTVWEINTTPKREKILGKHPTQKPIELLDRIIRISSNPGDIVLDPFCGSSSTGVSSILNKRMYIGIDNNIEYMELSKRRIESIGETMKLTNAKPVVKWAGGKSKLIEEIESRMPNSLSNGEITTYIEPFIGGGALFFHMASKYKFEKIVINDINKELILMYKVIRDHVNKLISILDRLQDNYNSIEELDNKKVLFYEIRELFNKGKKTVNYSILGDMEIEHSAYMIFLNKTCFNGLYRENKSGGFNVPFGQKQTINLYDKDNILSASDILKNAIILNGDFEQVKEYIDNKTLIYMDPPYRPLSGKNSFKDYSKEDFNDESQIRLSEFFKYADLIGAKIIESNSNPKNTDETDDFFDNLYSDYKLDTIMASRSINSKGTGRGKISELLITNY